MPLLVGVGGLSFTDAYFEAISGLTTTGTTVLINLDTLLQSIGPATNYQVLTNFQTWVCALAMLLGWLELFTLLILFTPAFWRS